MGRLLQQHGHIVTDSAVINQSQLIWLEKQLHLLPISVFSGQPDYVPSCCLVLRATGLQ